PAGGQPADGALLLGVGRRSGKQQRRHRQWLRGSHPRRTGTDGAFNYTPILSRDPPCRFWRGGVSADLAGGGGGPGGWSVLGWRWRVGGGLADAVGLVVADAGRLPPTRGGSGRGGGGGG